MTRTNIRITELKTRLTALERERAAIVAEIETLQSAPSEQTAATKVIPSETAGDLVDRNSTIENKIALFRRLFRGRSDVFPIRWENRTTGRSGYAPACANEWQRGICEKPKVKCSACPNQAFFAVDDVAIERHLRGTDANGFPFDLAWSYSSVTEDEEHVPLARASESGQLWGHCGPRIRPSDERPVAIDPTRT
jgi:hypothetical protein